MLRTLLGRFLTPRRGTCRRSHPLKSPRRRLLLEQLEDRLTPSTLTTNLSDYAPGTDVTFTGTGFQPGETINLNIASTDSCGTTSTAATLQIVDGGAGDLDGAADGNFTAVWNVGYDNQNATLSATATGGSSLATAAAVFHDGGDVYTSFANGQQVNANIYSSKAAVYINGGPQNMTGGGHLTDGTYVFQVTDPSGSTLLSSDGTDATVHRELVVSNGHVYGVPPGGVADQAAGTYHATGDFNAANGSIPVQLLPYLDTPNNGGEYKVWITPVADYDPTDTHSTFGFRENTSGTDNFKVRNETTSIATQVDQGADETGETEGVPSVSATDQVHDSATFTSSDRPTGGTVTYTLWNTNGTLTTTDDTQVGSSHTVNVAADGTVPDSFANGGTDGPLAPGTYYYVAAYSGDNTFASATGAREYFLVTQQPSIQSIVTVEVHKFEDHNGDGIRNGSDADIAWNFAIVVGSHTYNVTTGTPATFDLDNDADAADPGDATFDGHILSVQVLNTDLSAGISWSATEATVAGWTATTPTSASGTLSIAAPSAGSHDFGNFHNIMICAHKFYDANVNGSDDDGQVVAGIHITLVVQSGTFAGTYTKSTDANGNVCFGDLDGDGYSDLGPGTYTLNEVLPNGGMQWIQTAGIGGYTITAGGTGVQSGGTSNNSFGDVCLGGNNGVKTLGFWSNNNGKAILQANDSFSVATNWRKQLNLLNLRNANGTDFDVSNMSAARNGNDSFANAYAAFRTWLLGATATNMAYMLSAQLVTMKFNTLYLGLNASTMLYVGTGSAINTWANNSQGSALDANLTSGATTFGLVGPNSLGFISVSNLMSDANTMLLNYYSATAQNAARQYEEALKILLDGANNNLLIFAEPTPCPVIYI
jgi:hypothetical protein